MSVTRKAKKENEYEKTSHSNIFVFVLSFHFGFQPSSDQFFLDINTSQDICRTNPLTSLQKKRSFPVSISSVNVTKFAGECALHVAILG